MKKTYWLFTGVLIVLLFNSGANKQEYLIVAAYTIEPPTIDGYLNEPVWLCANVVELKENRSGNTVANPLLMTQVLASFDSTNLYFAFICKDPDIWTSFTQRDEYLWTEEVAEVFIDVDDVPETYVEIEVSPANILFDSYIIDPENIDLPATASFNLPGIKTGVNVKGSLNQHNDIDDSWTVEIAIPFENLTTKHSGQAGPLTDIKINFYRRDKNHRMKPMAYAWRNLNFSINMDAFGDLPSGKYDIYLKINDPKETSTNKCCIQFANHEIWNTALGANLLGTTKVAP